MQSILRQQGHSGLRQQWFRFVIFLGLVTTLLAACTEGGASATPQKKLDTVRVGTFGVFGDAPIYIALERGYFKDEGITVQTTQIAGGLNELVTSLATGKLDVGNGSASAGLYNAFENSINLKIVADNALTPPGDTSAAVVVRKDLANTVKTPADLKGRNIAVLTAKGSTSLIYLDKLLAPAGLTHKDVHLIALPFPNMQAALANGSVDLAIIIEPFLTLGLSKGIFSVFKNLSAISPNSEGNVEIYTNDFASQKDLANRFAIARLKGARDYYNAFFKNKDRAAIVSILTKYTSVKDASLYAKMNFTHLNPNGSVNVAAIQSDLDWFVKDGDVTKPLDISSVVDDSFVQNALHVLGTYPQS